MFWNSRLMNMFSHVYGQRLTNEMRTLCNVGRLAVTGWAGSTIVLELGLTPATDSTCQGMSHHIQYK